jgi:hypothetical protein
MKAEPGLLRGIRIGCGITAFVVIVIVIVIQLCTGG